MLTKPVHEKPLISVLMGIYYQRSDTQLLRRSIQSVLTQTYSHFELLICDDGSTTDAQSVIERFARADSRIQLVRHGNLISLPQKLNACLRASSGPLIARMDDDDFSHPNRFETQTTYLVRHPENAFVGSNVRLWRDGETVGVRTFPKQPGVRDFLFVQPFLHPTLMLRREVLLAVGGYSESRSCQKCEDYDLLLRLYEHGFRGENLQESLLDYTIPDTAKGSRTMRDRWNEVMTRYRRFRSLGLLPGAWPYVAKPILVGILPEKVLEHLKRDRYGRLE